MSLGKLKKLASDPRTIALTLTDAEKFGLKWVEKQNTEYLKGSVDYDDLMTAIEFSEVKKCKEPDAAVEELLDVGLLRYTPKGNNKLMLTPTATKVLDVLKEWREV